jgi:hypothetical protein
MPCQGFDLHTRISSSKLISFQVPTTVTLGETPVIVAMEVVDGIAMILLMVLQLKLLKE